MEKYSAIQKAIQKVYKQQHEITDWEVTYESFLPSVIVIEILEQLEIDLLQEIEETTNKDIYKID